MKKLLITTVASSILIISGCGTHKVSKGIAEDGSTAQTLIFPAQKTAWIKEGTFPNVENLTKIDKGVAKDDLYNLVGVPHFSEGQNSREWDYVFKFRNQKTRKVDMCRYKILFDTDMKGQSFYWYPNRCKNYVKAAKPQIIVQKVQVPTKSVLKKKRITLAADALFAFNKYNLQDMLPAGRVRLNNVSRSLVSLQKNNDTRTMVTGHTDFLGDDMYNLSLSQLRAQTVRAYLISRGISPATISATGAGETAPVKTCYHGMKRSKLIQCLQPNRRVTIDVAYY